MNELFVLCKILNDKNKVTLSLNIVSKVYLYLSNKFSLNEIHINSRMR